MLECDASSTNTCTAKRLAFEGSSVRLRYHVCSSTVLVADEMARMTEPEIYDLAPPENECENCGSLDNLALCTRCRTAWFCSVKCQRSYWPFHKSACASNDFADALEKNQDVLLYAKLPGWFKVPTPLGSYNPDWAVLIQKDGMQRLYFVVETKSSLFTGDMRNKESAKIECGKAHFKALAVGENPARYEVARSINDFIV